ncbi:MAG TPA: hypothetical protein VJ964_11125 [Balneolaceae bacterium]|nr:hypothetical protein [Balneolaceae bacterium]
MFKKKLVLFVYSLIGLLFLTVSCTDNPPTIGDTPPELPPSSSMNMDFSGFQNNQKINNTETQSSNNFGHAVAAAIIMKAVVDANLVIPKILLTAAANSDAQLNDNDKWEWSYSKTADGNTYSVRLVASRDGSGTITWDCYVTNSNLNLNDQLFFSGTTNSDATEGTWTYYNLQNTGSQEEVSQINWTVNGQDNVNLKLQVTSDRNDNKGDYIKYTFDGTLKTATYYDASTDETTEIQINVDTHIGYFISPNYNNGMQSCWDNSFQDTACSAL